MIEIKGLTKKYGNLTVYENFNFSIDEGKVTCILGESGSGKTTLLNCIAKLTDCIGDTPDLRCSYVFQSPCLVPNLTVYENLKLICKDDGKIDEILECVRLSEKKGCYPKELSGGQKQRVSLARALIFGGDIMLLDEPFSSLDLKLKNEMYELFARLVKERGITALIVTHDVEEALALGARTIVIKDGKIVAETDGVKNDREKMRSILISALVGA